MLEQLRHAGLRGKQGCAMRGIDATVRVPATSIQEDLFEPERAGRPHPFRGERPSRRYECRLPGDVIDIAEERHREPLDVAPNPGVKGRADRLSPHCAEGLAVAREQLDGVVHVEHILRTLVRFPRSANEQLLRDERLPRNGTRNSA